MKKFHLLLILAICGLAHGNEALDVLEGRRSADSVTLPPTEGDATSAEDKDVPIIYTEPAWAASALDSVWARATLFEDQSNPWVQQVAITGYFDFQAAFGEVEVDGVGATPARNIDVDGSMTRRARLGARIRAFRNTDIEASAEFAGDSEYRGIERLSARTELTPSTSVTYGKFRPNFGIEYRTEPEFSPYPDRAMFTNMIAPSRTLGVMFHHERKDWEYGLGWFSSDSNPEFPQVEGDGILAVSLARTFVERAGDSFMRTRWHLDYLHNFDAGRSGSLPRYNIGGRASANGAQMATNPAFRHLLSTGFTIEQERFSFLGDFMFAKGDTTAWGLTLGPTYWAIPGTLKLVGRYHYAGSDDPGALVATVGASGDLFRDDTPFFIGDEYHSFYLGANLHLYQDRMLLMGGVENVILNDEAGAGFNAEALIWHTGAKLSF